MGTRRRSSTNLDDSFDRLSTEIQWDTSQDENTIQEEKEPPPSQGKVKAKAQRRKAKKSERLVLLRKAKTVKAKKDQKKPEGMGKDVQKAKDDFHVSAKVDIEPLKRYISQLLFCWFIVLTKTLFPQCIRTPRNRNGGYCKSNIESSYFEKC